MRIETIRIAKIDLTKRKTPSLTAAAAFIALAAAGLWISAWIYDSLGVSEICVSFGYYLLFIALPILLYMMKHRGLFNSMRLQAMPLFPTLLIISLSVSGTFLTSIINSLWCVLLESFGLVLDLTYDVPSTSNALLWAVITEAALPAVFEELLIHGFAMAAWEKRGSMRAWLATALLFALLHGNPIAIPAYLFSGLICGYLVFALDSVYAGIVYHTLYNTICLVVNFLSAQSATIAAAEETASYDGIISIALLITASVPILMLFRTVRKHRGLELLPASKTRLTAKEILSIALAVLVPMPALIMNIMAVIP